MPYSMKRVARRTWLAPEPACQCQCSQTVSQGEFCAAQPGAGPNHFLHVGDLLASELLAEERRGREILSARVNRWACCYPGSNWRCLRKLPPPWPRCAPARCWGPCPAAGSKPAPQPSASPWSASPMSASAPGSIANSPCSSSSSGPAAAHAPRGRPARSRTGGPPPASPCDGTAAAAPSPP